LEIVNEEWEWSGVIYKKLTASGTLGGRIRFHIEARSPGRESGTTRIEKFVQCSAQEGTSWAVEGVEGLQQTPFGAAQKQEAACTLLLFEDAR